jgi:6-phosphofructokinase 1
MAILQRPRSPARFHCRWHGRFVHVPMPLATRTRKQVDPAMDLWMSVIETIGQPRAFA